MENVNVHVGSTPTHKAHKMGSAFPSILYTEKCKNHVAWHNMMATCERCKGQLATGRC